MHFSQDVKEQALIVRLGGELDMHAADELRQRLEMALDRSGARRLVINLADVHFMDSSGLGVLLAQYKRLRREDGKVALVAPSPIVKTILEASGLLKLMPVYESEERAVGAG